MPETTRSVIGWLRGAAPESLALELDRQARLLAEVQRALPAFLAPHCRHCVASAERLILYVDSPAFATQLRFCGPELLAGLAAATGRHFRDCQVRSLRAAPPPPVPMSRPGSAAGAAAVRAGAEAAESGEIREALLRLGRTLDGEGRG